MFRKENVACLPVNMRSCLCAQIKGTFRTTYGDAVMGYDGRDDRSLAVDGVQRGVSVPSPPSLFFLSR